MPPWIVLVDCRASGHIWKSRQYKGNALGVLSTSLPRSRHVVATWRYSFECVHLKEFVLSKVFFLDGVRASSAAWQAVVTPLNNPGGPEGDTVTVAEQLLNTEYCNDGRVPRGTGVLWQF